jgi:hypothetical protein
MNRPREFFKLAQGRRPLPAFPCGKPGETTGQVFRPKTGPLAGPRQHGRLDRDAHHDVRSGKKRSTSFTRMRPQINFGRGAFRRVAGMTVDFVKAFMVCASASGASDTTAQ